MPPAGIIVLGLVVGSLAAFNALGITLLWRTTRLVNLAQPALGLVGGVLTGLLVTSAGWSFWWASPVGIAVGALLGLASERLALRRLQDQPRAVLLVATVGLAQLLSAAHTALPFAFGGPLPTYTVDLGFTIDLFPVRLLGPDFLALFTLPVVLASLWWFLHRSRLGLAACALGQDVERAGALGVPAGVVRSVVWAVAGAVASVGGILSIPVLGFSLGGGLGSTVLLFAIAPAVLAGMRSLPATAVAALGLGVFYRLLLWYQWPFAGSEKLMLGGAIVVAVALQRRRLGRDEAASRASSWVAATTPRPLPWSVARLPQIQLSGMLLAVLALVAAVVPPVLLNAGGDVLYATSAALALGSLAVAVAWMFAGEIMLGHWGLAGFGATIAAFLPGPWPLRCVVAAAVMGVAGGLLALAARRTSGVAFAVLGLAAAAAAPVAVLQTGARTIPADPQTVGMVAAATAILAAIAMMKLRSSVRGAGMIAARDDPQRAPWLGVNALRARLFAMALSGALAGLAGALYLSATSAGFAPGAFDAELSLALLAMGVVGGLGSPAGAIAGAAAIQAARLLLPGPWRLVASGIGVLIVVRFLPGGLSRPLTWIRDRAVGVLARPPAPSEGLPPAAHGATL